jgi:hypothetical protein
LIHVALDCPGQSNSMRVLPMAKRCSCAIFIHCFASWLWWDVTLSFLVVFFSTADLRTQSVKNFNHALFWVPVVLLWGEWSIWQLSAFHMHFEILSLFIESLSTENVVFQVCHNRTVLSALNSRDVIMLWTECKQLCCGHVTVLLCLLHI